MMKNEEILITIKVNGNIGCEELKKIFHKIIKLSYDEKLIEKSIVTNDGHEMFLYPHDYTNNFLKEIGINE